ncbi:MAG TPA: hypothetical protein VHD32_16440 [Candidatus Didemnitutus sp.]|nr:hypothetical protein [Candidatus Didemnitutus sp.]
MKALKVALACMAVLGGVRAAAAELVHVDDRGVIRWNADDREVALFGANYSLPSASDFRAAGMVGADRKKLVEQDLTHFARMGWDGMRLCLWGDWENSDRDGNLIVNEHLDVLDYAVAQARKRGIFILLTPITTYGAWWPDGKETDAYPGFSKTFQKSELGTNPAAIAVQCNYLKQLLRHINPYTGVALKDEPAILFVETINEPWHHPEDFGGSVAYIDALAGAVRETGCQKLLFYNLSQDFRMAPAIKASVSQGVTFAWYPTGLVAGHTLRGNFLRTVDDFTPMYRPDLSDFAKIVYEFDSPDLNTGYMYPAMARAFRGVGAQFATMFSYDMLATAPYNLGWQTHFLNLVYSPRKAMSAVIAAEVMRTIPRLSRYGDYPNNRSFGPFRVSYENDTSEMVTAETYLSAGDTSTAPVDASRLRRVAGVGSSPVVTYEGCGAYFLDRLAEGVWRLEVYPDAVIVQDPFAQRLNHTTVASRLVAHSWPMTIRLPDLGDGYAVTAINAGNTLATQARDGGFRAQPGVYLLSRGAPPDRAKLPARIGPLALDEFVCPPAPDLPPQIIPEMHASYESGSPVPVVVTVVAAGTVANVNLNWKIAGETADHADTFPLRRAKGYRYAQTLPAGRLPAGPIDYYFTAVVEGARVRLPEHEGEFLHTKVVDPHAALSLFDGAADIPALFYTRIGDTIRHGIFQAMPASGADPACLRLIFPLSLDRTLDDYTASLTVKDRLADRAGLVARAGALLLRVRGSVAGQHVYVTLVEADGTSWSKRLELATAWQDLRVPLSSLGLARGVMLPLGFPERWNYWIAPAAGRGGPGDHVKLPEVERLQFSVRPEGRGAATGQAEDPWVEVASVRLEGN